MLLNGAQILISQLQALGVKHIFGYPGASILPVYDVLYSTQDIQLIDAVSEVGAVFMADGYARAGKTVGVCIATSGPGATNLVTGIASAYMDSIPLVVITGNVKTDLLGHDAFQEVDIAGISMPITKYNYIVKDVGSLASIIAQAFSIANSGRKGPVLIDIPCNIFEEKTEYTLVKSAPYQKVATKPDITFASDMVNKAKRPIIYAGGGIISSQTSNELVALSEKLNAPVAVSMPAIGAMPYNHKNYIGVGTSVNKLAKTLLKDCDLFITLGARFSNKALEQNFASKNTKLLHLDIDRAEISKNISADFALIGDLTETLPALLDAVKPKTADWMLEVENRKNGTKIEFNPQKHWINSIFKHFGANQLVATDVGQHQLWTANYYPFSQPSRFLSSCGLGAMGYGLGAAIGAYFATGEDVVLITGDGSFNMSFSELCTVKNYNVPISIFIMNNRCLGMIREFQTKNYKKRYIASNLTPPDYILLAKSFGIEAVSAKQPEDLDKIFSNNTSRQVVIDCDIKRDLNSF